MSEQSQTLVSWRVYGVIVAVVCVAGWLLYSAMRTGPEIRAMARPITPAPQGVPATLIPPAPLPPPPLPEPPPLPQMQVIPPTIQRETYRPTPPPRAPKPPDPLLQERREALKAPGLIQSASAATSGAPNVLEIAPGGQGQRSGAVAQEYVVDGTRIPPRTPYELKEGFGIPIRLLTGINSSRPGGVTGEVIQDVYDSVSNSYLIIPAGTRVVGKYNNETEFGQARVDVAWNRLIFPDGSSTVLPNMPGGDNAGYTGVPGRVNNHLGQVFTRALLLTTIGAGIQLSQNRGSFSGPFDSFSAGNVIGQSAGNEFGRVASGVVDRGLNIPPTIEVQPGTELLIVASKDIAFPRPYEGGRK